MEKFEYGKQGNLANVKNIARNSLKVGTILMIQLFSPFVAIRMSISINGINGKYF